MTDADWLKLLQASPDDAEVKLGYATWLQDDADRPLEAEAWRWLVASGRRPSCRAGWWWSTKAAKEHEHTVIPAALWWLTRQRLWMPSYPTRLDAERDLVSAYVKARQEGWQP